ncbi:HAD-IA family hydrolase [Candidatus Micrarchaeota archaeon]|nr:HAD-IA family hydrolase [Candidatus Micrarchaeota archaeon]
MKAALFDLDNTLIDYMRYKEGTAIAASQAMVRNGLPFEESIIYEKIFGIYDAYGMEYEKTYADVVRAFDIRDLNRAERIQQAAIVAHQSVMASVLQTYPEVKPGLKELRKMGIRIGLVTDGPRNKAWKRIVLAGLENEFEVMVTHTDTGKFKPEPEPFRLALEKMGLKPSECLHTGDDPERDVRGARDVGMITCLARYGYNQIREYKKYDESRLTKADYEIESFGSLMIVVGEITGSDMKDRYRQFAKRSSRPPAKRHLKR